MKNNKYLRRKVAKKASKVIAQQVAPKVTDPGAPAVPGQPPAAGPKPPAGPGAPGAPGAPGQPPAGPKPKEDIEKGVEEDIRKEKSEEGKIDKLVEAVETMVDALADQKKILEKALGIEDTDTEKALEDMKDEDDEAFSADEFGVDNENLIVSKEDDAMTVKSLRKERKARLYKKDAEDDKEAAAAEGPSKTISEELNEEKAKSKTFKPNAPAPTITKVKKDETPKMYKLAELAMELNETKDKWVVVKACEGEEDVPLFEIEKTEENSETFATEDFAKDVFNSMKDDGVENTLESLHATKVDAQLLPQKTIVPQKRPEEKKPEHVPVEDRPISTPESKSTEPVPAPAVAPKKEETPGDYGHRFTRAYRLALSAMQKNLTHNPLKSAFFNTLVGLGMEEGDATVIIEAAFSKGADEHFEVALEKAEEYMEMSDEAFVETESAIGELETREADPNVDVVDVVGKAGNEELKKRAAKGSLPLSTQSKADPTDKVEAIMSAVPQPKLAGISKL
jgi:hypothetical protein